MASCICGPLDAYIALPGELAASARPEQARQNPVDLRVALADNEVGRLNSLCRPKAAIAANKAAFMAFKIPLNRGYVASLCLAGPAGQWYAGEYENQLRGLG
jgi:hypothetical protein